MWVGVEGVHVCVCVRVCMLQQLCVCVCVCVCVRVPSPLPAQAALRVHEETQRRHPVHVIRDGLWAHHAPPHPPRPTCALQQRVCVCVCVCVCCSDITNTLIGISGETVPEGGNLHIYYVHSATIYEAVVQIHNWCVTPHSSPTRGRGPQPIFFIF